MANGVITKRMDREHSGMPMGTSTLESGKMTKLVAMACSLLKSQLMRDNGFKTSSMARGQKSGMMVVLLKAHLKMGRNMDQMENLLG